MFYNTNVAVWERALRVAVGIAMLAYSALGSNSAGADYLVATAGLVAILTGFVGFCPMCALAGRKKLAGSKDEIP